MKKTAIYAGSFDPVTNGHMDIIERASKLFDRLIVAVGVNPDKRYYFPSGDRVALIKGATAHLKNVHVDFFGNNFLVDYAEAVGAQYLVRGVRGHKDFDDESLIQNVNADINNELETVFFIPKQEYVQVSSSLVKGLIGPKYWYHVVAKYVPKNVFEKLMYVHLYNYCGGPRFQMNVVGYFDEIHKAYTDPARKYHNIYHIFDMISDYETYKDLISTDYDIMMRYAIVFHDVVYNPASNTNEADSASWVLKPSITMWDYGNAESPSPFSLIIDLIRKSAKAKKEDPAEVRFFHDLDYAILAAPEWRYDQYAEGVKFEYLQHFSENKYLEGRGAFLRNMLEKDDIYFTKTFRDNYEYRARCNIVRELQSL